MIQVECLDDRYSTTRLCHRLVDNKYLDDGKIKDAYKFSIEVPFCNIIDSKIIAKEDERFDTLLFLPAGKNRQGEGGLRTRGYFKHGYEKRNGRWYIAPSSNGQLKRAEVSMPEKSLPGDESIDSIPLVTVVTVVYNGERYLEETIQSVLDQKYPNIEYIIIDGGSSDGTLEIIRKYENFIDYWISEKDDGIYDAMNKGVSLGLGSWIGLINADDLYEHEAISRIFVQPLSKENNKTEVIFGDTIYIEPSGKKREVKAFYKGEKFRFFSKSRRWIWVDMLFGHPSSFVEKSCYKKHGLYDSDFRISGDYEFFLRLYNHGVNMRYIPGTISMFREGGVSGRHQTLKRKENYRLRKRYNLFIALLVELGTHVNTLFKKAKKFWNR